MKKLHIFLASSNELKSERELFEIEIYRKGKAWFDRGIFLNLLIWEDQSAAISQGRSQDEYNKLVRESDFFVLLAHTHLGRYSNEEFEICYDQFKKTGKPKIFTYFKDTDDPEPSITEFKNRLKGIDHFFASFSGFDALWNSFNKELEKLDLDELLLSRPNQDKTNILVFNSHLTRELTKSVAHYNTDAKQLMEQDGAPGWELKPDISDTAKEILVYSYAGALGIQLSRVMSIGNEQSESKIKKYVENSIVMAKKTMQTICYILLSELWNQKKDASREILLSEGERRTINRFFSSLREFGVIDYFTLFECLAGVFKNHGLRCAMEPLNSVQALFAESSPFRNACEKMELIDDLLRREQLTLWDCQEVEVLLTQILVSFSFLTAYKMESIRRIEHEVTHQGEPCYLHRYIGVSLSNEAKNSGTDAMKFKSVILKNDTVLLYKERYTESVSLFPFIIDINAINNEPGVNLGFYSSRMQNNTDKLRYRYLNDNIVREITFKNIPRPDFDKHEEFFVTQDDLKQIKLDNIFLQFNEAMDKILR